MSIISVKDLSMTYKSKIRLGLFKSKSNEVNALKNINLEIEQGQIFGLLGPNGAGKTTLIKCLTTLLIQTSGSAHINGYDVLHQEKEVKASIGCMLVGERGLYWKLTGRENLVFFGRMYSMPKKELDERIEYLISSLELEEFADRTVESYSSGQRMKFAFAKSLLNDAPVIFLDEPTRAMDINGSRALRKYVKSLPKEGKTVIYTSHIMSEIQELCDKVAIIDKGEIIALDTPNAIKAKSKSKRVLEVTGIMDDQKVSSVKSITGVNNSYLLPLDNGRQSLKIEFDEKVNILPDVTNKLVTNGVDIETINYHEPSLEDVFVELTGRGLHIDT